MLLELGFIALLSNSYGARHGCACGMLAAHGSGEENGEVPGEQ